MKRLILHIGMNKAGSSSIQGFLRDNADTLVKYGINYPMSVHPHNKTIFSLINTKTGKAIQKKIINYGEMTSSWHELWLEEIKSDMNTTIISAEQLMFFPREDIFRLKQVLSQYFDKIVVIAYIRDYDSYISSSIQQRMKNGRPSIRTELKTLLDQCGYQRLLTWIEACPEYEFRLRPFRKEAFHKGDLISDFFHAAEIDDSDLKLAPAPRVNQSIGLYSVLLLERYNKEYPLLRNGNLNQERGLCHKRIPINVFSNVEDVPFRLDIEYSKDQAEKINNCVAEINRYLPHGGQMETVQEKVGDIEKQLSVKIPQSFYHALFKEYRLYLKHILDRS